MKKNGYINPALRAIKRNSRAMSCLLAILVSLVSILTLTACAKTAYIAQLPPFLPPQYYTCIEANPTELVTAYFSGYGNISKAENAYNFQYYVFKDISIKDWMVVDLDQGWLWTASGIKCLLVDANYVKSLKLEDRIDIVGYNTGVISYQTPGLLFKDCYVLPAGSVKLPVGDGGGFSPAY